jgi:hypothetical protein
MTVPMAGVSWLQAGLWISGLLVMGFAVSWLLTDVAKIRRTPYILWLTVVTGTFTGAYLAAVGVSPMELLRHNAGWGVLAGVVVAIPITLGMRRLGEVSTEHRSRPTTTLVAWEGLVYGVAEGVLLSALPALIIWHAADSAGWTARLPTTAAMWALALGASVAVITVHHLGYWDFRGRRIVSAVVACAVLTLAFLATGSILAPVVGHVALHVAGLRLGVELPPHPLPVPGTSPRIPAHA